MGFGESRFNEWKTRFVAQISHSLIRFCLDRPPSEFGSMKFSDGKRQTFFASRRTLRWISSITSSISSSASPKVQEEGTMDRQYSMTFSLTCRFFSSADLSLRSRTRWTITGAGFSALLRKEWLVLENDEYSIINTEESLTGYPGDCRRHLRLFGWILWWWCILEQIWMRHNWKRHIWSRSCIISNNQEVKFPADETRGFSIMEETQQYPDISNLSFFLPSKSKILIESFVDTFERGHRLDFILFWAKTSFQYKLGEVECMQFVTFIGPSSDA